jgi:hypothetical protein
MYLGQNESIVQIFPRGDTSGQCGLLIRPRKVYHRSKLTGDCWDNTEVKGLRVHMLVVETVGKGESRKSFTRLRVVRDGLACG